AIIAAGLIATSGSAFGQEPDTAQVTVGINITHECTISAEDLTFQSAGLLTAIDDATSDITVTCTPGTAYEIGLDQGLYSADAELGSRAMRNGDEGDFTYIRYTLLNADDPPWGETAGAAGNVSGLGNGAAQTETVTGR